MVEVIEPGRIARGHAQFLFLMKMKGLKDALLNPPS